MSEPSVPSMALNTALYAYYPVNLESIFMFCGFSPPPLVSHLQNSFKCWALLFNTANWGKYVSFGMERPKQGHQDHQMDEILAFQHGSLFWKISGTSEHTIIFLYQSRTIHSVKGEYVNSGKQNNSARGNKALWGSVSVS